MILDCDPGTDDALAVFLALGSPELDVLAITVAGGTLHVAYGDASHDALRHLSVPVAGMEAPTIEVADDGRHTASC